MLVFILSIFPSDALYRLAMVICLSCHGGPVTADLYSAVTLLADLQSASPAIGIGLQIRYMHYAGLQIRRNKK